MVDSGLVVLWGQSHGATLVGFAAAVAAGALACVAVVVALSVVFGHALLIGIAYVVVCEAPATSLIPILRYLSIREGTRGIADELSALPPRLFEAQLDASAAVAVLVIPLTIAVALASRRLGSFEVGDRA